MKVKVSARVVYHKYTETEIDIPSNVDNIQEYLHDNAGLWSEKLYTQMYEQGYEYGHGIDMHPGMEEITEPSEWRYDCEKTGEGGHL